MLGVTTQPRMRKETAVPVFRVAPAAGDVTSAGQTSRGPAAVDAWHRMRPAPGRVPAQVRAARQAACPPTSPPDAPAPGPGRPKGSNNKHKAPRQPAGKRNPKRPKPKTKTATG